MRKVNELIESANDLPVHDVSQRVEHIDRPCTKDFSTSE